MEQDINLIKLNESHLEQVRIWRTSEEVSQYMFTAPDISPEQQIAWFERVQKDPTEEIYIIQYEGINLGVASYHDIDHKFNKCQWSFYLGDTSVRGQGIGLKTEYNVILKAFDEMNIHRLEGMLYTSNQLVWKMHQKFGFRFEGLMRDFVFKNDQYHDVYAIALLKDEWKMIQEKVYDSIYKK